VRESWQPLDNWALKPWHPYVAEATAEAKAKAKAKASAKAKAKANAKAKAKSQSKENTSIVDGYWCYCCPANVLPSVLHCAAVMLTSAKLSTSEASHQKQIVIFLSPLSSDPLCPLPLLLLCHLQSRRPSYTAEK